MFLLYAFWDGVRALVFPRNASCAVCSAPLSGDKEEFLCAACLQAFQSSRQLTPLGIPPAPLDFWNAAFSFDGVPRSLVHRLKYDGYIRLGPLMSASMRACLPPAVDCLAPIPLHSRRQAARGFNQSVVLAQGICARGGPPCVITLKRTRPTRQQALLSRRQRRANVRGCMEACTDVRGKRILIIDDVLTTGSTAAEAARVLKKAGASWVGVLAFARA